MDIETLKKFERSAKLELTENERHNVLSVINNILAQFDALTKDIDTQNVKPLVSVLENHKNVLREDKAVRFCPRDELLAQAPETSDGCFVVPKTVD